MTTKFEKTAFGNLVKTYEYAEEVSHITGYEFMKLEDEAEIFIMKVTITYQNGRYSWYLCGV
jgi:hypothetical protein